MTTDFPTAPLALGHKGAGGGTVEKSLSASHTEILTHPSPYSIANWFIADFHSLLARFQSAVMLRKASQISLVAASSLGKCPRLLMILRNRECTLSMALVV
jgi:hypothetical protein